MANSAKRIRFINQKAILEVHVSFYKWKADCPTIKTSITSYICLLLNTEGRNTGIHKRTCT